MSRNGCRDEVIPSSSDGPFRFVSSMLPWWDILEADHPCLAHGFEQCGLLIVKSNVCWVQFVLSIEVETVFVCFGQGVLVSVAVRSEVDEVFTFGVHEEEVDVAGLGGDWVRTR